MKIIPLVGVVLFALLWINQEQRGILTPPTTREVLIAAAIIPEATKLPIPAIRKIRWPATTRYATADTQLEKRHLRPGN